MPDRQQITKKQHYVPRFYLKQFADNNGKLSVLDIRNKKIGRKRAYSGVCYEKFFYGVKTGEQDDVSQAVEDYLQNIEDKAVNAIAYFCKQVKDNKYISNNIRYDISYLMSIMWIRTDYFRQQMNRMSEDMTKKLYGLNAGHKDIYIKKAKELAKKQNINLSDKEIKKMRKMIIDGKYSLTFNNAQHLHFFEDVEGFANLIYAKNWRVYIVTGKYRFITSDTPVIEWFPEKKSFYGVSFLERKHYFPITPEVLIEAVYPISGKNLRRKRLNDKEVLEYNFIRPEYSLNYCYSDEEEQFGKILEIVNVLNRQGRKERYQESF
ncbi:DUF4238 domain-containing protein [Patescibacteria group bacterium]|nr:DUF4238 domain-containing protein [Patescibacteria group bacterium]